MVLKQQDNHFSQYFLGQVMVQQNCSLWQAYIPYSSWDEWSINLHTLPWPDVCLDLHDAIFPSQNLEAYTEELLLHRLNYM